MGSVQLDDSSSYLPRRHLALRTAGLLGGLTSMAAAAAATVEGDNRAGGGGSRLLRQKVVKHMEELTTKILSYQEKQLSSSRPTAIKNLKKAVLRDHQEASVLASSVASFIRHFHPSLSGPLPPDWLACTLALCSSENHDASRSAFAGRWGMIIHLF